MSYSEEVEQRPWWEQLGLRISGARSGLSANEQRKIDARSALLAAHAPPWLDGGGGKRVPIDHLAAELTWAEAEVELAIEAEEVARFDLGWSHITAAFEADDAEEVIDDGVWAGFTRARATAWLWNLIQYEPYPISPMFAGLRRVRDDAVAAGEIPEVARYAERARQLEDGGLTPHSYRIAQRALGRSTFTAAGVSTGTCSCHDR